MKKTFWIIALIVVALVLVVWLWQQRSPGAAPGGTLPAGPSAQPPAAVSPDTTSAIQQDINALGTEDVDQSFKDIDADINSL